MHCAAHNAEDAYFAILEISGLRNNLSVYTKAVQSIKIMNSISEDIGLTKGVITKAFEGGNTEVITKVIELSREEGEDIAPEMVAYPVMNNDMDILKLLGDKIKWNDDIYYSALLSGSMEMVKYVESFMSDIHDDHRLDLSNSKKGHYSLLLDDIIYIINGTTYFSHTMNYAIQSGNINMVKYVELLGYGLTTSNIITCIQQGSVDMLSYVLKQYTGKLPSYVIHYFSMINFIGDKLDKYRVIMEHITNVMPRSMNDYKKETAHIDMIQRKSIISETNCYDVDYLMEYGNIIVPDRGYKNNNRMMTLARMSIVNDYQLDEIFNATMHVSDRKMVNDLLFLFGSVKQIDKYNIGSPSLPVILERMCYCRIPTMCLMLSRNLIDPFSMEHIQKIACILDDKHMNLILPKYAPSIEYCLKTKNIRLLMKQPCTLTIEQSRKIVEMDDVGLVKHFGILASNDMNKIAENNDCYSVVKYFGDVSYSI
jgi:hypothetical protein